MAYTYVQVTLDVIQIVAMVVVVVIASGVHYTNLIGVTD